MGLNIEMNTLIKKMCLQFLAWYLKQMVTRCAHLKQNRSSLRINFIYETVVNLNKCLDQIKLPIWIYKCAKLTFYKKEYIYKKSCTWTAYGRGMRRRRQPACWRTPARSRGAGPRGSGTGCRSASQPAAGQPCLDAQFKYWLFRSKFRIIWS